MAKLYFKYGAMNSGKSTILLQTAFNYEEKGKEVLVIKPSIDTKGNNMIVSRVGLKRKVDILLQKDYLCSKILSLMKKPDLILVDEAQFLTKGQVDDIYLVSKNLDIPIICYGIRTDFKTNGFEGSSRLLEISDKIEEIKTICRCGKKASFNLRKENGVVTFDGNQIEIDAQVAIEYESVCGNCYIKEIEKYISRSEENE